MRPIKDWSLTSLKEELIKIGTKVVAHGRYAAFQMTGVAFRGRCSPKSCGRSPICGHRRRHWINMADGPVRALEGLPRAVERQIVGV